MHNEFSENIIDLKPIKLDMDQYKEESKEVTNIVKGA